MALRHVIAAAASVLFAGGMLAGCSTPTGPAVDEIAAVDFRQSQAIEGFDDAEYTQDDPAAIVEFQSLLREYGIDPATWQGQDTGCSGNRVTQVTIRYADSDLGTQFSVDSCSDDPFEQEADELFTSWREDLAP